MRMARLWCVMLAGVMLTAHGVEERRLSMEEFRDRAEAAWLGQIAGVCWGAPTEFKFNHVIIPEDKVPQWHPDLINQAFGQDDLYVEMTFLRTLEQYGLDVNIRQAGLDFANSQYGLWCANEAGRSNLRLGIAPPDSGHPQFNRCGNDIDYQIEADYSGIISPGLPQRVIALADTFGRLMNYGDGILGGIFVGAMYAEAYFARDVRQLIDAGLAAIPAESDYAEMVRQMLAWHRENPRDWQWCWGKILEKYRPGGKWLWKDTNGGIDARLNGAMIMLGLLYGEGDLDQTIVISMRGGYDSDCSPSSAAGPLFAIMGKRALPGRFKDRLQRDRKFKHTEYTFDGLMAVTEKLMRQIVVKEGGRIETDAQGVEWIVVPVKPVVPPKYVPTWRPEPPQNAKFTLEEMAQQQFAYPKFDTEKIKSADPTVRVQEVLDKMFPGWVTSANARDMSPGFRNKHGYRERVLLTHPPQRNQAVTLSRKLVVPTGNPRLVIAVANAQKGNFDLVIRVNNQQMLRMNIGGITGVHWQDVVFGLEPWAGKEVTLEVDNQPTGWNNEAAYWHKLEIQANNQ